MIDDCYRVGAVAQGSMSFGLTRYILSVALNMTKDGSSVCKGCSPNAQDQAIWLLLQIGVLCVGVLVTSYIGGPDF